METNEDTQREDLQGTDDESQEDNTEGTVEGSEGTTENEFEDIEVADHIPDDFLPPEEFESDEARAKFFEDNYGRLIQFAGSEEIADHYKGVYGKQPEQNNEEIAELKAIRSMVNDGNAEEFLKIYAPDYLANIGESPMFSEEDKTRFVVKKMQDEFGKNYQTKYDADEAGENGTVSQKMFDRQEELMKAIDDNNEANKNIAEQHKPVSQEQIDAKVNEQFENDFKDNDWSQEEFKEFVDIAVNYAKEDNITLADVHKIMFFDGYIDDSYKRGLEDGRKGITKDIDKLATTEVHHTDNSNKIAGNIKDQDYDKFGSFGHNANPVDILKLKKEA